MLPAVADSLGHLTGSIAQQPQACSRLARRTAIIRGFPHFARSSTMEAERLNAIAEKLADLAERGRELRRYL